MTDDARTDVVNRQYERWTYPEPIQDVGAWVRANHEPFDPSHSHRIYWPDEEYKPDLDILIAGCGTNQAAIYAYNNREAKVVAVDVSQSSLDHQQFLKDKHGLANLELRLLPIEELPSLGQDFDLIVSTGVLHHMADPLTGMKALADCLRPNGAMGVMLYATYGRAGVYLLQSVFRDLGLGQDEESLLTVKDVLANLSEDHPIRNFNESKDLKYDGGLVDMFLHGRDRSYTVDECVDLVAAAGLEFQRWLNNGLYYINDVFSPPTPFTTAMNALPERKVWSVMERLVPISGKHSFIACRPERAKERYTIDLSTDGALDFSPLMRVGCSLSGSEIIHPQMRIGLNPAQFAFADKIDGHRTIRDIAEAMAQSPVPWQNQVGDLTEFGRKVCIWLWRLDVLTMAIPPSVA